MRILDLPLKKEWYEMIERGEKCEDYREIKQYWISRLMGVKFDLVRFRYGYTKKTMTFKIKEIMRGRGKPEWGAPNHDVFIIKFINSDYYITPRQ
jgi:hypothetical protein